MEMPVSENCQQLDWVRLRIFQAHSVHIKTRGDDGVAAYVIPVAHTRKKNTDEHMSGEMSRVKAREVRKGKSTVLLPPWAFDDTKIVRAVSRLPDTERRWVRYAYSGNYTWDDESGIVFDLWERLAPQFTGLRGKTLAKVRGMVYLAVQNYKSVRTQGKPAHTPERIRQLVEIPEGNWRRDWLPRWRLMRTELASIDHAALSSILEVAGDRAE